MGKTNRRKESARAQADKQNKLNALKKIELESYKYTLIAVMVAEFLMVIADQVFKPGFEAAGVVTVGFWVGLIARNVYMTLKNPASSATMETRDFIIGTLGGIGLLVFAWTRYVATGKLVSDLMMSTVCTIVMGVGLLLWTGLSFSMKRKNESQA